MPNYRVINVQTIEAENAIEATEKAWQNLRNDGSSANHFLVQDDNCIQDTQVVDLMQHYGDDGRPEDLADMGPEFVKALELVSDEMGFDDGPYSDLVADLLTRAKKVEERRHA